MASVFIGLVSFWTCFDLTDAGATQTTRSQGELESTVLRLDFLSAKEAADLVGQLFRDDLSVLITPQADGNAIVLKADREAILRAKRMLQRLDVEICSRQVSLNNSGLLRKLAIATVLGVYAKLTGTLIGQRRCELSADWRESSICLSGGTSQLRGAIQLIFFIDPNATVFVSPSSVDSLGTVFPWHRK